MRFTGLVVEQTDVEGKVTITYHKSQKGLLRDHRKGKCDAFCGYCYDEGCNGANWRLPRSRKYVKTLLVINYIVTTQGFSGRKVTECETKQEVWAAIGNCSFGALTEVYSPTGKDVSEFLPF